MVWAERFGARVERLQFIGRELQYVGRVWHGDDTRELVLRRSDAQRRRRRETRTDRNGRRFPLEQADGRERIRLRAWRRLFGGRNDFGRRRLGDNGRSDRRFGRGNAVRRKFRSDRFHADAKRRNESFAVDDRLLSSFRNCGVFKFLLFERLFPFRRFLQRGLRLRFRDDTREFDLDDGLRMSDLQLLEKKNLFHGRAAE